MYGGKYVQIGTDENGIAMNWRSGLTRMREGISGAVGGGREGGRPKPAQKKQDANDYVCLPPVILPGSTHACLRRVDSGS